MSRLLAVLLALACALPAAALAQTPRTSMPDVEDEVMCVSCKVPLNIAESTQADRERELIVKLVDQGLTKEQIKTRLVQEYGKNVLAMPDEGGVGIAVYVVPIVAFLGFAAMLAFLIPRWRRREPRPITEGDAPAATDAELKRLDEDLERVG